MKRMWAVRVLSCIALLTSIGAAGASWAQSIDLMAYMHSHTAEVPTDPSIPRYNRRKEFGGWAHQDPDKSCHDTREMVLERDEDVGTPLKFNANGCTIVSGLWHDPYTGTDKTSAHDLQIDHVVPLKNAYYSGAYSWSPSMRCNYANYLGNSYHLVAAGAHENMSKGDRGPERYLPPNHFDRCTYVSAWMRIKMIWELTATAAEVEAIEQVIQDEGCDSSYTTMEQSDLDTQRVQIRTPIRACAHFGS